MINFICDDVLRWCKSYKGPKFHALLADPPAGISFMSKGWDTDHGGRDSWIANMQAIFSAIVPHLYPGAHCIVWALPRTSHWTATALENAGLEIREIVTHVFGSGFPKSANVSKHLDRMAGVEREVIGRKIDVSTGRPMSEKQAKQGRNGDSSEGWDRPWRSDSERLTANCVITAPATDAAKAFDGMGTALKPASEHWIICRKPIDGTIAENCATYGSGALNIDAGRIAHDEACKPMKAQSKVDSIIGQSGRYEDTTELKSNGRWPANFLLSCSHLCVGDRHDESCPIRILGEQSGESKGSDKLGGYSYTDREYSVEGFIKKCKPNSPSNRGDTGTAARFFHQSDFSLEQQEAIDNAASFYYCAKASRRERDSGLEGMPLIDKWMGHANQINGSGQPAKQIQRHNPHPTVKPLKLAIYLSRLLSIPDAYAPRRILNPFGGSGTESLGALLSGQWDEIVAIEQSAEYVEIAKKRAAYWQAQMDKVQPALIEAI